MASGCELWNRFESAGDEARLTTAERRQWQEHLWQCRSCRAEWEARAAILGIVAALEQPQVSHGFEARLERRIAATAASRLGPSARRWLALYWMVAALASVWIVVRHPIAVEWFLGLFFVGALTLVAAELVPARVLRRAARAVALARAR